MTTQPVVHEPGCPFPTHHSRELHGNSELLGECCCTCTPAPAPDEVEQVARVIARTADRYVNADSDGTPLRGDYAIATAILAWMREAGYRKG